MVVSTEAITSLEAGEFWRILAVGDVDCDKRRLVHTVVATWLKLSVVVLITAFSQFAVFAPGPKIDMTRGFTGPEHPGVRMNHVNEMSV